jgi:hypothetical protein
MRVEKCTATECAYFISRKEGKNKESKKKQREGKTERKEQIKIIKEGYNNMEREYSG